MQNKNLCICFERKQHRQIRVYVFGLHEYTFKKATRQGDHAKPFIYILKKTNITFTQSFACPSGGIRKIIYDL